MTPRFSRVLAVCTCLLAPTAAMTQEFGGGFGGGPGGGLGGIGGSFGGIGSIADARDAVESALGVDVDLDRIEDLVTSNITALTGVTSGMISDRIGEGRDFCARVERGYQIACIADRFDALADILPRSGDYREIRQGLLNASRDLDRVAKQYADPAAAKKRFRASGGTDGMRTGRLTKIDQARRAQAEAAAKAVISEFQTVLLRSGTAGGDRKVMYQEIAQAVGSNKLLLRS